jgi:hypothetical protein
MKTNRNSNSVEESILNLAHYYRSLWKIDLCESTNIDKFGENEYFGGKADAFEEALEIIRKHKQATK